MYTSAINTVEKKYPIKDLAANNKSCLFQNRFILRSPRICPKKYSKIEEKQNSCKWLNWGIGIVEFVMCAWVDYQS